MIKSMTGFGKASGEYGNKKITAEIKSLNSKQADVTVKVASVYKDKEIEIRNEISNILKRGKIEFSLTVDDSELYYPVRINKAVVRSYSSQIEEIAAEMHIKTPENMLGIILQIPEAFITASADLADEEWAAVHKIIISAVEQLQNFRTQEGKALETIFRTKIANIAALLEQIPQYETERIDKVREKLLESLQVISDSIEYDKNRLEMEMIFYIDRLDVNEEKARLKNHLQYFIETMEIEQEQGKKLGFIVQEIGREINTLGSKANHSEMQKIVVIMKDELEQIKEQILNVL